MAFEQYNLEHSVLPPYAEWRGNCWQRMLYDAVLWQNLGTGYLWDGLAITMQLGCIEVTTASIPFTQPPPIFIFLLRIIHAATSIQTSRSFSRHLCILSLSASLMRWPWWSVSRALYSSSSPATFFMQSSLILQVLQMTTLLSNSTSWCTSKTSTSLSRIPILTFKRTLPKTASQHYLILLRTKMVNVCQIWVQKKFCIPSTRWW